MQRCMKCVHGHLYQALGSCRTHSQSRNQSQEKSFHSEAYSTYCTLSQVSIQCPTMRNNFMNIVSTNHNQTQEKTTVRSLVI